ncbi:hypothetical protein PC129_g842 [Phytophthora cactorum]|uniref:cGMP-dependent protein kinase n=1 Tax=Phytophthora cactorum TaxID=29920 RepID=A0A8T1IVV5_9STRA|nr:hypothetical protein PC129_g842 [Phytophthora cactorum]KAG4052619.1 hypothetical protein PC123_g12207 [Phytophthora cactorum]
MDFSKRMKDLILPPAPPSIKPSANSSAAATTTTVQLAPPALNVLDLNEHKGVRRAPIKEEAVEPGDLDSTQHVRVPKNNQTRAMITKALKAHYLFSSLDQGEIDEMIDVMAMVTVQAGESVIAQGTSGKCFYVLESGSCDIVVDGKLVGTYTNGDAFGELALLYNCPRAATIRATTGCILWTVERTTFRKIMATTASATQLARVNFLKNVELLQRLSNNQLQKVAAALKLQRFNDGDYIIRQGEDGNTFYIIVEGTVRCTSRTGGSDEVEKELMTLQRGNYFGEMALVLNEPRQANCIAVGAVDCYVMDRAEFTKLLGPLRSLIDRQMRIRVLRSVPLLSSLTDDELDILAHALNVVAFEDKSTIIKEGDAADTFYMISDGKVSVRKSGFEIMQLRSGEFFGERALLANEPRAADCVAIGRVECLTLQRAAFEQLLGKLDHIMQREMQRQQLVQQSVLGGRTDIRKGTATPTAPPAKKILYKDLDKIRTIGTGTFGRVIIHNDQNKIFEKILQGRAMVKFPPKFDPDAKDLVMKLLETNPALRIGSLAGGMQDVVNHPFFTNAKFDWAAMVKKTMKTPYTPAIKDAFDAGNFDAYPEDTKIRPFTGSDTFEGF